MTALLASVRSYDEARDAAHAGADLIDLKEPRAGALGRVDSAEIRHIVRELRAQYPLKPISATIGDIPSDKADDIAAHVIDVDGTGVDYVKVGVFPGAAAARCLAQLAQLPARVVPVLLCDAGVPAELVAQAAELGFAGVVFDTAGKDGRTLFDCVDADELARCVEHIRARGAMVAIAGSLGWEQLPQIRATAPDIAGFRTALCTAGRTSQLDPAQVARWAQALHHAPGTAHVQ